MWDEHLTVRGPMADPKGPETVAGLARRFFSYAGIRTIVVSGLLLTGLRIGAGGFAWLDALIVLVAIIVWPLIEWTTHVLAFHIWPLRWAGRSWDTPLARFHRRHHLCPGDIDRVVMPASAALSLAIFSTAAFWLLFQRPQALTAAACFSWLGLLNEWTHLRTHSRVPIRSAWLRRVKQVHQRHHYLNHRYWFAFTGPWVDRLLRRAPDPGAVERNVTVE